MNIIPDDVLQRVIKAQKKIDAAIDVIGKELDAVFLKDGQFIPMTIEELETAIKYLPDFCFYKVDLKQEWRKKIEN